MQQPGFLKMPSLLSPNQKSSEVRETIRKFTYTLKTPVQQMNHSLVVIRMLRY